MELCTNQNDLGKHFHKHIRMFNAGMAMASLQVNETTLRRSGPAAFKVSGMLHRRMGPLTAQAGAANPACIQTCFLDPIEQDRHRASRNMRIWQRRSRQNQEKMR